MAVTLVRSTLITEGIAVVGALGDASLENCLQREATTEAFLRKLLEEFPTPSEAVQFFLDDIVQEAVRRLCVAGQRDEAGDLLECISALRTESDGKRLCETASARASLRQLNQMRCAYLAPRARESAATCSATPQPSRRGPTNPNSKLLGTGGCILAAPGVRIKIS